MALKCQEVMSFRTLKQLSLVAGESGLDRVVTWPYIVQTNSIKMWIFGGELLFFSGLGLRCDADSLVELLKEAAEKNASGVIFLANDEMTSEVIGSLKPYADDLRMPIFELPRESIIVEITKEISSKILEEESRASIAENLLERLCFGDAESVHEWVNKAGYTGIDLSIPYQVAVIYIDNLSGYLSKMNTEWDHSLPKFISFYREVVVSIVKRYDDSLLTMYGNNVVYLSQQTGSEEEQARFMQKIQRICESINTYFKGIDVYACLGGPYAYSSLKNSYLEAERSMEITCRQHSKQRVSLYDDLGVYQLFFSLKEEELRRFCNRWIGSLVEYDHKNGAELFRTLDVFFKNKMNLIDSAAELYIHRNTLNIRLSRIEKIIGKSLKDTDTLHGLLFGVLIKNYLDRKTI